MKGTETEDESLTRVRAERVLRIQIAATVYAGMLPVPGMVRFTEEEMILAAYLTADAIIARADKR